MKKIINIFKVKIIKEGKSAWYETTLFEDGTIERKELKNVQFRK